MTKETAVKASNLLVTINDVEMFMDELASSETAPLDLLKACKQLCDDYLKKLNEELARL